MYADQVNAQQLRPGQKSSEERTFWAVIISTLLAYVAGLVLFSLAFSGGSASSGVKIIATAIVAGAAVAIVGGLLGFLFGMPRAFSSDAKRDAGTNAGSTRSERAALANDAAEGKDSGLTWMNNNLVEVSDWLTKIVVGVGLVQLNEIVVWLGQVGFSLGVAAGLAPGLSAEGYADPIQEQMTARAFGVTVILLNFGVGFLVSYIYARTLLTVMFAAATKKIGEELERDIGQIREAQIEQEETAKSVEETAKTVKAVMLEVAKGTGGPASVFAKLYQPAPEGFQDAIELAEELLSDEQHKNNARLYGYLAFGLGQKYRYDAKQGESAEALKSTADQAYQAIERALELSPKEKNFLRRFWNPEDPNFVATEDDLVPFWRDISLRRRFSNLLG